MSPLRTGKVTLGVGPAAISLPLPPLELPRRPSIRLYGVLMPARLDFT